MGRVQKEAEDGTGFQELQVLKTRTDSVLERAFREDKPPAKKSKHNLVLVRKFLYNILWIVILYGDCAEIMTEAMYDFSDGLLLRKKYFFGGIESFY